MSNFVKCYDVEQEPRTFKLQSAPGTVASLVETLEKHLGCRIKTVAFQEQIGTAREFVDAQLDDEVPAPDANGVLIVKVIKDSGKPFSVPSTV